jgi:hypothetical protein
VEIRRHLIGDCEMAAPTGGLRAHAPPQPSTKGTRERAGRLSAPARRPRATRVSCCWHNKRNGDRPRELAWACGAACACALFVS